MELQSVVVGWVAEDRYPLLASRSRTCRIADTTRMTLLRLLSVSSLLLLLSGCVSYGVIDNAPLTESTVTDSYSIKSRSGKRGSGDIVLTLAFSGGGTRAAALAYGVLEELRDTTVIIDGQPRRLIDEIDTISSVSGGSFTSAYYGLYGERIFEDFEDEFLNRDVECLLTVLREG